MNSANLGRPLDAPEPLEVFGSAEPASSSSLEERSEPKVQSEKFRCRVVGVRVVGVVAVRGSPAA